MPAPKGHPPYPGCEKGGQFGYLGKPKPKYSSEEINEMSEGLIEWIQQDSNIWIKYYFLQRGLRWHSVLSLAGQFPQLQDALDTAKEIQESRLLQEPYDFRNKKDAYHARWMLARHHKGEWQEVQQVEQKPLQFGVNYGNNPIPLSSPTLSTDSSTSAA